MNLQKNPRFLLYRFRSLRNFYRIIPMKKTKGAFRRLFDIIFINFLLFYKHLFYLIGGLLKLYG